MTIRKATLVIENGGTVSGSLGLEGHSRGSIQFPAAFTGTNVQASGSNDGTNFTDIGSVLTKANNGVVSLPAALFDCAFMRLTSQAAEAAEREIIVHLAGG